jgi:serine/threonine protein kinase/tetratricopeptide (TPR) repeat protein
MPPIGPDRWLVLSPYLDRALDFVDESERTAWLATLRRDDPAIGADVEALLRAHRVLQADGFLESSLTALPPEISVGTELGAYRLLAPIGRGGMGTVWLAERSDGRFDRHVAIKLLDRSLVGEKERFRREGRMLARLAHPQIAQLLDAGVSPAGQPYFVLEHVDGEPIDQYCSRRSIDIQGRLRLFLDVLSAVAHAHASLIVHRDIKPSNVLVTADGCVKLLDFGIAKLLADEDGEAATHSLTVQGALAMTPAYAAPEQVRGAPVSTATDIYALGVLLYVLLTGRHPAGAHLHSPADLMNAIVNVDPPRPSSIVSAADSNGTSAADAAAERGTSPDKLRRMLQGDLDTIVGVALKKAPTERFASVTAFADDVGRYLRHEPIAARRDALGYRAAKFVRRNRPGVAAAAIVAASLSVGLYVTNRERAIAEGRFMQVRRLANRVLALDREIGPLPGSTKARHEIVAMAKDYLESLRIDAEADADLALEIGGAYFLLAQAQGVPTAQNLGQSEQAEESLRAADALLESVLRQAPRQRTALLTSAEVALARMILADSGRRREDALTQARKAAARLELLLESGAPTDAEAERAAMVFNNIALGHKNNDLYAEAIAFCRRVLAIVPASRRGLEIGANAWSIAADAMRLSGNLEDALRAIREARNALERLRADGPVRAATMFNVLWREGVILGEADSVSLGRSAEAIAVLQQAFDEIEQWAANDAHDASSRLLFASAARELGHLLRQSDPARALAVYDHARRRLGEVKDNARARRGEIDLLTGSSYPLRRLGRSGEAKERLDAAFALMRQLNLYPSEKIQLGLEADAALRASADHEIDTGHVARGIETYQTLLDAVSADAAAETSLTAATDLSRLYEAMTPLYRSAGNVAAAEKISARRLALWEHWQSRLPGNTFVHTHLVAARAD